MDEFGVLVESIGFKAHGRSAPMAKLKPKPKSHFTPSDTSSFVDSSSLPVDDLDVIFRSSANVDKTAQSQNVFSDDDNIFGGRSNQFGGVDLESVLISSNKTTERNGSNLNSAPSGGYDDLLRLNEKQSGPVHDDVFGILGLNSSGTQEKTASGFEDFIPGFEEISPSNQGIPTKTHLSPKSNHHSPHPSSNVDDDPFRVFEKDITKSSMQVSLDELDDFVIGRGHKESITTESTSVREVPNGFENVDDLLFGDGVWKKHDKEPNSTAQDSQFDFLFDEVKPKVQPPPNTKKDSPFTINGGDITTLFEDVVISTVEFQEIDDEPEERREARLKRYMRMKERMDDALAEKNQRDLQSQREQEEKRRLAETLDYDIKRWAAGKEGNLRALLSSLQQVLWPECGWRAVSLTDMITSDSVKKVYRKATLFVHPDKVQQKGANIQQKYIAEKVFDILMEAWNKFSAEELR